MPKRAALAAAAIGLLVMVAMVAATRTMPPIVMSSDLAMAEVSTALAARGDLMVGPYSRFGWNHPGPLYFYMLAPLYALAGQNASALFVAAVAINLCAILGLAWSLRDHGHGLLSFAVVMACLILAWRLPRLLASPWTAHVPVLASLTFVATAGAVAGGRHRLVPLLILIGTFIAQTHLSYVPMVGVLGSVTVALLIAQRRQTAAAILAVSAGLWLLLWLPVLTEAAMNDGGNLAALWRFFVTEAGSGQSFSQALEAWGFGLTGILRGDLALPWGGHFAMLASWWRLPVAVGQVAALVAVAWRGQ
jgi:hypothetical protein